jgi:hypothetical protein
MVVSDFDATCEELTRTSHLAWSPEIRAEIPVWTRDLGEVATFAFRAVYSVMAPHIEVIQAIPGTFMTAVPGRPLHHVGYWSDNLAAESEWLERQGLPRVACAMNDGAMYGFAYHVTRDGFLQELVDRRAFPDWDGFLERKTIFTSAVLSEPRSGEIRATGVLAGEIGLESICETRRFCPTGRHAASRSRGDHRLVGWA